MGGEPNRSPMMMQIWWLIDRLSRVLEPRERDAVLGDLAESGDTGTRALRDVLGLVIRRQAALWANSRPWLILMGLIVPLALLLSVASRRTADESAVYTWLYANNWDWALLKNAGFWYVLADSIKFVVVKYLTLVCLSWTAGFALGSVSRGIVARINSMLFCLMLLFGELVGAPVYLAYYWQYVHRTFPFPKLPDGHAPVSALMFYRMVFPLIVQLLLVAIPALWGMRQGTKVGSFSPLLRVFLWVGAVATLVAMVIQTPGFGLLFLNASRSKTDIVQSRLLRFLQLQFQLLQPVIYWPILYLMATVIRRYRHRSIALA